MIAATLGGLVIAAIVAAFFSGHAKTQRDLTLPVIPANELKAPSLNPNGVEIRGASPRESALLNELLKKVPADEIGTISSEHNHERGKRALVFSGPNTTRAEWEQEVLGSLFVLKARQTKLGGIPIANLVTVRSAGSPDLQPIDSGLTDADMLKSAVVQLLDRTGARLTGMAVFTPIGSLPALIVGTPDAASFFRHRLKPLRSLLSSTGDSEGYYLLVVDSHHGRVLEEAYANRLGTGTTDEPPSLQGCDPEIAPNSPVKLPPCPAK